MRIAWDRGAPPVGLAAWFLSLIGVNSGSYASRIYVFGRGIPHLNFVDYYFNRLRYNAMFRLPIKYILFVWEWVSNSQVLVVIQEFKFIVARLKIAFMVDGMMKDDVASMRTFCRSESFDGDLQNLNKQGHSLSWDGRCLCNKLIGSVVTFTFGLILHSAPHAVHSTSSFGMCWIFDLNLPDLYLRILQQSYLLLQGHKNTLLFLKKQFIIFK